MMLGKDNGETSKPAIIGDDCFLACSIVERQLELVLDNLILELAFEIPCT